MVSKFNILLFFLITFNTSKHKHIEIKNKEIVCYEIWFLLTFSNTFFAFCFSSTLPSITLPSTSIVNFITKASIGINKSISASLALSSLFVIEVFTVVSANLFFQLALLNKKKIKTRSSKTVKNKSKP